MSRTGFVSSVTGAMIIPCTSSYASADHDADASIAVVGASADEKTPSGQPLMHLRNLGYAGDVYPSVAVEAARLQLGVPRERMAVEGSRGIAIGDRFLPTDQAGRQLINYYGPDGTIPTYSLLDLLRGSIAPAALAGRVVILGASAAGAGDRLARKTHREIGRQTRGDAGAQACAGFRSEGEFQLACGQRLRESRQRRPPECAERVAHPFSQKNAAPGVATVGTTSARSRSSLRRSQLVSAISRQP